MIFSQPNRTLQLAKIILSADTNARAQRLAAKQVFADYLDKSHAESSNGVAAEMLDFFIATLRIVDSNESAFKFNGAPTIANLKQWLHTLDAAIAAYAHKQAVKGTKPVPLVLECASHFASAIELVLENAAVRAAAKAGVKLLKPDTV